MDFSGTAGAQWFCDGCDQIANAEVPVVLDTFAQPDLLQDVIEGTFPYAVCPHCAFRVVQHLPLLVYRTAPDPQLLFLVPDSAGAEVYEQYQAQFVEILLDRLGPVSAQAAEEGGVVRLPYGAAAGLLRGDGLSASTPDKPCPPLDVLGIFAGIDALGASPIGRSKADGPRASQIVALAERGLELVERPDSRGKLHFALGVALPSADEGERSVNIERAIGVLLRSAEELPRAEDPIHWAMAQFELGRVYDLRNIGDPAVNQELAIGHLERALEVVDPDNEIRTWALATMTLAKIHTSFGSQSRPDRIEKAIGLLSEVVDTLDPAEFKEDWCDAVSHLAGAYNVRQDGDPAVNLAQAQRLYQSINAVETPGADPEQWANNQVRFGVLLLKRTHGDRLDNHRRAGEYFEAALRVYEQVGDLAEAASTYDKLAIVAGELGDHSREIHFLRAALAGRPREEVPLLWARTQLKLGHALLARPGTDPGSTRSDGLRCVEEAVKAYEETAATIEHGIAQYELAMVYAAHGMLLPGYRDRAVIELESAAVKLRGRSEHLHLVAAALGDAYSASGDWGQAAAAYEEAVAATDTLYRACLVSTSRDQRLRSAGDLHQRAAYALAKTGRVADAVRCLEQGRARAYGEALSPDRDQLQQVAREDPEAFAQYERAAQAALALESENRELGRTGLDELEDAEYALGLRIEQARTALDVAAERIRSLPGRATFLGDFDPADTAGPGGPLCYLAAAATGSLCLIVRPGRQIETVWGALTWSEARDAAVAVDLAGRSNGRELRSILNALGQKLISPLAEALGTAEEVVLIPCGALAHLPLHAAILTETGEPLISKVAVSYAPSARLLAGARRQAAVSPGPAVLVAAADNGNTELVAADEVEALTRLFDTHIVTSQAADLLEDLPNGTHVHLACHGDYRPGDPLSSGLDLGGGRITLADLLDARPRPLQNARIVTLSACESAVIDSRLPDEAVGLPAGILLAGGAGVVCSQWEARDSAALLLMVAFYRRLLEPARPAEALRQAQLWLRAATVSELLALDWLPPTIRLRLTGDGVPERPFRHPYLWAPFTLVGT